VITTVGKQGDEDRKHEKTINRPLRFEDISEDFESNVEEEVKM
jgi:hypothetical protein